MLGLFMLSSCTTEEYDVLPTQEAQEFFNPPSWIQGKWQKDNTVFYKFTKDDFFLISGNNETSFKAILSTPGAGSNVGVDESISSTDYNFVIKSGTQNHEYKFKKINNNTIQWVNYPYSSTVGAFYLTRQ